MGPLEKALSRFFPKFRQQKWIVGIVMVAELLWVSWAAYVRPLLDTVGRYETVKSDWPSVVAGVAAFGRIFFHFASSPTTAIVVFSGGFLFLFLDRRFGADPPPSSSILTAEQPNQEALVQSPTDESESLDQSDTSIDDDEAFPIKEAFVTAPIIKGEDGSLCLADTKPSGTDAFLIFIRTKIYQTIWSVLVSAISRNVSRYMNDMAKLYACSIIRCG